MGIGYEAAAPTLMCSFTTFPYPSSLNFELEDAGTKKAGFLRLFNARAPALSYIAEYILIVM
jgi:hypothetical protein